MPLTDEKKKLTRERLNLDQEFRDEFLTKARNMYMKALAYDAGLEDEINRFELILGNEPNTYEFAANEADEIEIFEHILDAYDNKVLLEEKASSTIN